MKSTISILLCFFILLQSGLHTLEVVLKLNHHKNRMAVALKDGRFNEHLISIKASQTLILEWENNHEFFMNGQKYDVVSISKINGEIIYKCISDKAEEALINKMAGSEKKSAQWLDFIKKFNLQFLQADCFKVKASTEATIDACNTYLLNYSFLFSRCVIKPPIF